MRVSSSGLMSNEDSSTLPEHDEDTTLILQLLLNCEVVLEPTPPSYFLNLNSKSICFIRFPKGE